MQPARLSILGVGLLGGSIGLAVRSAAMPCRIVGYGHRQSTLDTALEVGAIDEATPNLTDSVAGSDLIVLCTPVGLFRGILTHIAPALKRGAIVTDVGSTKRSVVEQAERALPKGVHFVGSHPMAGSEKRGVEFARADLFRGALCILTPTGRTDPHATEQVEAFWRRLGMQTTRMSPEEHDRRVCAVSHVPHAVAAALVAMQEETALALAGKGFLDTTRIAGGDGGLWRDIFLDNRDNLKAGLSKLRQQLDAVEWLLDAGEGEALQAWLDQQAARRQDLLNRKLKELNPD